jgi:hypothetical protein
LRAFAREAPANSGLPLPLMENMKRTLDLSDYQNNMPQLPGFRQPFIARAAPERAASPRAQDIAKLLRNARNH